MQDPVSVVTLIQAPWVGLLNERYEGEYLKFAKAALAVDTLRLPKTALAVYVLNKDSLY